MRKPVLIIIHANTYFTNLFPVAKLLIQSNEYNPILYFDFFYPTIYKDLLLCKSLNISFTCNFIEPVFIHNSNSYSSNDNKILVRKRVKKYLLYRPNLFKKSIKKLYYYISNKYTNNVFYQIFKLKKKELFVKKLIKQFKPVLFIFPSDNRYDIPVFIKAAHKKGIPVILAPAFMASAREWAGFVANNSNYQVRGCLSYLISKIYKKWVFNYENKSLLALPVGHILARRLLKIVPPLPWVLHSGYSDAIVIESSAVFDYCVSEGLAPNKMVITGSVDHDLMSQILNDVDNQKQKLYQELDLPLDKPMLLSALPPDNLYFEDSVPNCDFRKYSDLVAFWIKSLRIAKNYNVIICLHPSVKYEDMKYIETWGCKIATENTTELIPLCDIFVACVSATIQWAIASQKPVINYDVYRYKYTDYINVGGVINIEEKNEYLNHLERLTQDSEFYKLMVEKQKKCSAIWGVLDGQAGKRILQSLEKVERNYPLESTNNL